MSQGTTMSHSKRCLDANRFGDGFDCICDEEPLPKALARIEELERQLKNSCRTYRCPDCGASNTMAAGTTESAARITELERDLAEGKRLVAEGASLLAETLRMKDKLQERAVELEEEKQLLEKQVEGYALGLRTFAANPKLGGMVPALAVAEELMRIIGRDHAPMDRDKVRKGQLSDKWDELARTLPGSEEPIQRDKALKAVSTTEESIRLSVPARIRALGGLGPVIIAAECVANQWEMGNVPSGVSLDTLCKAMKLYSRLSIAIEKARCTACGCVICTCPEPAA